MISRRNQAVHGALLSLAALWFVAIPFGLLANAHFDGPFAVPKPNDAPRNMLDFQARNVFFWSVFYSLLLVVHWSLLLWRQEPLHGHKAANFLLTFALFTLSFLWLYEILDEYYQFSLFCIGDGKPVSAIDMAWQCKSAYYAHKTALPCILLGLIISSFVFRLLPAKRPPVTGDV